MPAGRRQHERPAGEFWAGLLALPDGGIRFCRRGGANMNGRQAGFGPAGGIWAGLLAWPDGGIRFCRRGGANMGGYWARFGPACWRNAVSGTCRTTLRSRTYFYRKSFHPSESKSFAIEISRFFCSVKNWVAEIPSFLPMPVSSVKKICLHIFRIFSASMPPSTVG